MTEKRYFKRMWEDEFYIFDSQTISEKEFDEKVEYEDYQSFADSLMGDEIVELLNENEQFRTALKELKEIGDYQEGRIQELNEQNTRLTERNKRQYRQLDNLYTLIEKQDWKTLTGLIQEFQECEEQ